MSYCLNPNCLSPRNPDDATTCQYCKSRLLVNDCYCPLKPIGKGGFGRTFLAQDFHKPSQPACVIKQFHGKGFDDAAKAEELFYREAQLQEKLGKHPQIPELMAFLPQDEYLYLVQEFIDGCNLNEELKQEGTFTETKVWQLLQELLPILQFVHENNVIHRDIKPENIIRHSVDNTIFLVDFGIAKLATEAISPKTGTVIGSEGYTAPEQHEGKPQFASDLYSLGATCYRLLTWADPSRLLHSWVDWQKEIRDNLEKRDISDELIHLLTKLLQTDIKQRYKSAAEVLHELQLEENKINTESLLTPPVFVSKPRYESWKCVNIFNKHHGDVLSVAISPNGRILASGSTDHSIKIWNLQTGEVLHSRLNYIFDQKTSDVISIVFSPDGKTLVTAGWGSASVFTKGIIQQTIKLWDLNTMEVIRTFLGHSSSVLSVAITPDGQTLVSSGENIKLWNLNNGTLLNTLVEHSSGVNSVGISPNNEILVSGSKDNTIKIWEITSGNLLNTLTGHSSAVKSIAISPDSQILASGSGSKDNTIKIWEITSGNLLNTLIGHSSAVTSIAISPNGHILASGSIDCTIKIWDLGTGVLLTTLSENLSPIYSLTFSPDSQTLVSGSFRESIKIWQCDC